MRFGMDFGGTNIKSGIFAGDGVMLAFEEKELTTFTQKGDLLQNLLDYASEFCRGYQIEKGGLAIKGLVNTETGVLEEDIGAGALLAGKDLRDTFGKTLDITFFVDNDARAYAWGEWKFGAGKGSSVMVCMTLGTGLGCSLVVDQKPYQGSDPLGGLLGGHISIDRNGETCPCGNRGCLELYCSATALTKRVREQHPELQVSDAVLPSFFAALKNNGKKYRQTLQAFQEDLAIGIVNIIHAYGPETVVIGGGVMNSADLILPGLVELVHGMAWTFPRKKVKICASRLGNRAAAQGVAFHPRLD